MAARKVQPQQLGRVYGSVSTFVMATTGLICRTFLCGLNSVEVVGRDGFLKLLDSRRDVAARKRGLLTVSNHVSVLDDPMIWGVLPFKHANDHRQLRWSLGSHDICYPNKPLGRFFFCGQTLPTHRLRHSPWGGLFQPTLNEAVRLLSAQPAAATATATATSSLGPAFFSTNNIDRWPSPSSFTSNRHAWVHIFPEGMVHQHDDRSLRYFKWGVARLILESEPAPDIVPMFIDGPDRIMHEERRFPRFIPRIGKKVRVVFGDTVAPDKFADLRQRWQKLVAMAKAHKGSSNGTAAGDEKPAGQHGAAIDLKYGPEAQKIRSETALRMRNEILQLRREAGFPDEDPGQELGLPQTWANEPNKKRYRSQVDDSMVYEE